MFYDLRIIEPYCNISVSKITDNIFLGGLFNSQKTIELKNIISYNNISSIITIWDRGELDINFLNISRNNYLYIPIKDNENERIDIYLKGTYEFIKSKINENKNILIHCYAGISRSASIVINYFIMDKHITFNEAFNMVYYKRRCIYPNESFINQIKNENNSD
jgi:protein-tyrosine phosphatase